MSSQSQLKAQAHGQVQQPPRPVVCGQEAANAQNPPFPVNFFTELGRGPLVIMAKGISAMCQGNAALRAIQQSAAYETSVHHANIAQKLSESCAPGDLMAVQTELLRHSAQSVSQYWQQLAAQMLQTQVAVMRSVGEAFDSAKGLPMQLPQAGGLFNFDPLVWAAGQGTPSAEGASEKSITQH